MFGGLLEGRREGEEAKLNYKVGLQVTLFYHFGLKGVIDHIIIT